MEVHLSKAIYSIVKHLWNGEWNSEAGIQVMRKKNGAGDMHDGSTGFSGL